VNESFDGITHHSGCLQTRQPYRVTVVLPYYGYARQDRKDQGRVPISAKLVANLAHCSRCQSGVTLDLHAAQIQGFFDIPVDHLMGAPVFINYIRDWNCR